MLPVLFDLLWRRDQNPLCRLHFRLPPFAKCAKDGAPAALVMADGSRAWATRRVEIRGTGLTPISKLGKMGNSKRRYELGKRNTQANDLKDLRPGKIRRTALERGHPLVLTAGFRPTVLIEGRHLYESVVPRGN